MFSPRILRFPVSSVDYDFDPYLYRDIENRMTNTVALLSVIKSAIGTGCLAMPFAFNNSGYVNGIIGTMAFGCILLYATHILMNSTYVLCKRYALTSLTYRQSMKIALMQGPQHLSVLEGLIGSLVDVFQGLYHFGICCVYVLFISDFLRSSIRSMSCGSVDMPIKLYALLIAVPLIMIFTSRKYGDLFLYSLIANILIGLGLFMIIVYLCYDLPSITELTAVQNVKQLPLFFGTIAFSLESIGVLYAIEANMERPQDFLGIYGVLNQGMCVVIFVYMIIGFYGYWHYGVETQVNILLNMPDVCINHIIKALYSIGIFLSYPMQGYVTVDVVWRRIMANTVWENWKLPLETIVRIILVLTSVLVCISFPEFDVIIPLVGSSCISFLGLIFPGIIDICTRYEQGYGDFNMHLLIDIFLILLGIIGGVAGTLTGLVILYNRATSDAAI